MKKIKELKRRLHYGRIILLVVLLLATQWSVPAPPSFKRSDFQGGAGDQKAEDLFVAASPAPARGWVAGNNGTSGFLIGYDLAAFSPLFSLTTPASNTYFEGLTLSGSTLYPVGAAHPPSCGASDGVGDTESKSMLARYTTGGTFIGCQSANFFPYRGGEINHAALAVVENGTPYVYVVSSAENCGFGHTVFVLTKYDAGGSMVNKVTEPGVSFTGFNCIGGSNTFSLAALNGNIYVAGQSNLTGAGETGGFRPVLIKYDSGLNRLWKARPSDVAGYFNAVTATGGALYAVGTTSGNTDYLIEKYDENNNRLWSKTSGGASNDVLMGVVGVGNRVFTVGYTSSSGAGGTDAVILDIDPATGNTLSTTLYGGAQDDKANGAATDGTYLYVAGESRSFASAAGNVVGQADAMLLQFCPNNCFVVTNTNDSGAGSLRQAVTDANSSAGPHTIIFNIPTTDPGFAGGVFTIRPSSSALPTLLNNITIDGTTQTTFTGDTNPNGPEVVLNGGLLSSGGGLNISGDGNTVRNLVVNGFSGGTGISIAYGIDNTPSNNRILDNYVGTDATGTTIVPNGGGLSIHGFGSPSIQAQNNVLQNNLVSGNAFGITLCDAAQTTITNNLIGTDRTGTNNLGNNSVGVHLACAGAPNNLIANNTIAFNGNDGIRDSPDYRFSVSNTPSGHQGNKFSQNSIFSNSGLGINLLPPPFATLDGVTPNDNCDSDSGGNLLQNFPVITSADTTGSTTTVQGTLNSTASTTFTLEFFANDTCDASGNGEGKTFIGSLPVTTDAACTTSFTFNPAAPVAAGKFITATATNPGNNTSEFSACAQVPPLLTIDDVSVAEGNLGTIDAVFRVHLNAPALSPVTVSFDTVNDTATAPADYVAATNATVTIPAHTLTATFTVAINGDLSFEGNERFFVNLSNPSGATIADGQAVAIVADDEPTNSDFDKDGRTDAAIWNPTSGKWSYFNINTNQVVVVSEDWGHEALGDRPVPGDYDGDGQTDVAVFRNPEGNWYIIKSTTGASELQGWGQPGDIPVPGDYNGDRLTDYAVFRPDEGNWYIRYNGGGNSLSGWGSSTDTPVPGDYDGDGMTDVAVFRHMEGNWYIIKSNNGSPVATVQSWGISTDKPVPGDYDGDGKTDVAVYRSSEGSWHVLNSSGGFVRSWGNSTDIPVPGNYDGDNKTDIAIWREDEGNFYIIRSATNTGYLLSLGGSGDIPVPSVYQPQ